MAYGQSWPFLIELRHGGVFVHGLTASPPPRRPCLGPVLGRALGALTGGRRVRKRVLDQPTHGTGFNRQVVGQATGEGQVAFDNRLAGKRHA